ncbi:MAG TPA: hypothetical protein PKA80_10620 [Ignavibacteriaceae bacterium]|nr:hypothetical protein [Ignavibacteriaceae bacterium]
MTKYFFIIIILSLSVISCERLTETSIADDGLPPAVPVGLRIVFGYDGEVGLEWNANNEADIRGYNVYRRENKTVSILIAFTTDSYFFDDSLNYDSQYYYKISAVDLAGKESAATSEILAEPENIYSPVPPRFPLINARNWENNLSIYLSWEKSFESDVEKYFVFRSEEQGFIADTNSFIGESTQNYFNDTIDLKLDTKYFYKIEAIDKGGLISPASEEVNDEIYQTASLIFPEDSAEVGYFDFFKIKTINKPAAYRISVMTNPYFGEYWATEFYSQATDDTISVRFNPDYVDVNVNYYLRIAVYSVSEQPNSISNLYNFIIVP